MTQGLKFKDQNNMENYSRRTEEIFYGNNSSKATNCSKIDNIFKWQKWPFGKGYIKAKWVQCVSNQLIGLFKIVWKMILDAQGRFFMGTTAQKSPIVQKITIFLILI